MEPCKPPAISRMSKTQLLEEAGRVGLVVHHKWTVEEIKAAIQEHRMNDPNAHPSHKMKSVTQLNMPELKLKAAELGIEFPSNVTKGKPVAAYPRQLCDPSDGVDEDRQVQGLGVWRDSEPVRHVGSTGSADERKPARGAGEVREMAGVGATPTPLWHAHRGELSGQHPVAHRAEDGICESGIQQRPAPWSDTSHLPR